MSNETEDTVTITADEYERLTLIERQVNANKEIEAAWDEAIVWAIDDLLANRFSEELLNNEITVRIKDKDGLTTTFVTEGISDAEDVEYVVSRVYQRHAEREAEIMDNYGLL